MVRQAHWNNRFIGRVLCWVLALSAAGCMGDGGGSTPRATQAAVPSISGSPSTQAVVGLAYSFQPTVSSSDLGTVGFNVRNKPRWATFSVATGQLAGTPSSSDVGTYPNIKISVSNGARTASLPGFTITVAKGGAVTLAWQAPTTNTNGTPLTDLAGYEIDYGTASTGLNQSVTLANPTTTVYRVQNLTPGIWYFAVNAFTSDGSQSSLSNVVSTTVQ